MKLGAPGLAFETWEKHKSIRSRHEDFLTVPVLYYSGLTLKRMVR